MKRTPPRQNQCLVLFVTRAWSTSKHTQLSEDRLEERETLNEMRASCVRALKREYGALFIGGFVPSEHATTHYSDLLLDDPQWSHRGHYFMHLRSTPICVSTHGLRSSVPWKIAEYVLFHRAIVSQPLCSEIPGDFAADSNYLRFTTADQCVEGCERLRTDDNLRERQMHANEQYAYKYLHPDVIVRNALSGALAMDDQARRER